MFFLYWFLKIENASVGKTSLMVFHVTFVLIMRFAALLLHTELTKTTTESLLKLLSKKVINGAGSN